MNTLRNILIFVTIGLIVVLLFYMDFNNLSWANNRSDFIGLISCILLITSMILSNRYDKRQSKKL